jgi:hypothetical protein
MLRAGTAGLIVVAAIVGIAVFVDWERHHRAGSMIVVEAAD